MNKFLLFTAIILLVLVFPATASTTTGTVTYQTTPTIATESTYVPSQVTSLNTSIVSNYTGDPYSKVNTSGMFAWYKFDEGSGTTVSDSSGQGHNSTASNKLTWSTLKYNSCGSFNNVNTTITLPNAGMTANGTFTCSFFANFSALTKVENNIISQTVGVVNRNYEIFTNGTHPAFTAGFGGSSSSKLYFNNISLTTGKPYFITYTVSGTTVICYVFDGTTWVSETKTMANSMTKTSTNNFAMGYMAAGTYFGGTLDDMKLWNRTLSQSEVYAMAYDDATGLTACTNSNSTQSAYILDGGSATDIPYYSTDDNISAITYIALTSITLNNISVYNYPLFISPFYATINAEGNVGIAPTANFSANITTGNAPLSVQFTDTSTGSPDNWSWNFGDSFGSYAQNPVHTYTEIGTYSVNLTVSNSEGTNSKFISNLIATSDANVSTVTISPFVTVLQNPNFENWSDYVDGNAPDNWVKNVNHGRGLNRSSDAALGDFSLSIIGDPLYATCGATSQTFTTPQQLAKLSAWVKTNNNTAGGIEFYIWNGQGEQYKDVDHTMIQNDTWTYYTWTFQPPNTNDTDTYISFYSYVIGSNVWQIDGVQLSNAYSQSATETQSGQYIYQNSTYTPDQVYETYQTKFINYDLTNYNYTSVSATIDGNSKTAYIRDNEVYVDVSGLSTTSHAMVIQVSTQSPPVGNDTVANFTANNTTGKVPLFVQFNDTSSENPTSWLWDFGDNVTSTEQNPLHEYNNTGYYNVSLCVNNSISSNFTTKEAYIWAQPPDAAPPITQFYTNETNFSIDSDTAFNVSVPFIDTSISLTNITQWSWIFGDGQTSTEQNPVHIYNTTGLHTVTLTTTNIYGTTAMTLNDYINISRSPPVVDFIMNRTEAYMPAVIQFTNNTSNYSGGLYLWEFGDGTNSTEENPVHLYANDSIYQITLIVTRDGQNYSITKPLTINYVTRGMIQLQSQAVDQLKVVNSTTGDAVRITQNQMQSPMYKAAHAVESGVHGGFNMLDVAFMILAFVGIMFVLKWW